jgi:hypothetical protein
MKKEELQRKNLELIERNEMIVRIVNSQTMKINELTKLLGHYELTLHVLTGRLQEKDALISKQNSGENEQEAQQ